MRENSNDPNYSWRNRRCRAGVCRRPRRGGGGRTAWTDKHPSYEWTNGPSGKGVDDFWGLEIIPLLGAG